MIELTLQMAETALKTAQAKARALGTPMTVTVVDEAGRLVLSARGGNDVILDFDIANDKLLFDATAIRSTDARDWNGDGIVDLRLNLTAGGSVTLLGLSSLSGVQTGLYSEASDAQQALTFEGIDSLAARHALSAGDFWLVA